MIRPCLLLALALGPQLAAAGPCAAGAKAFPSSFKNKGKVSYANLFDISYYGTYKVVEYSPTLSRYDSGWHPEASMKGKQIPPLVLYQCGTTRPFHGDSGITTSEHRFFEIPVQKAALGSTGPLPFMELLSVTEAIALIDLSYVSSPCSQLLEHCVPGVHLPSGHANWSATAGANAEVVFTDSFGTGWAGPEKDIPFQISLDPGSLQRAEWVRFVAAFFNEEVKADEIFDKIKADYTALKAMASQLSSAAGRVPQVVWVTTSGSNLIISNAHYKRDFVQDAGGRLVPMPAQAPTGCSLSASSDGSQTLQCTPQGAASFKAFLAQADVIIDESYIVNHDASAHNFTDIYSVTAAEVPALARSPPDIFRLDGSISDKVGAEGMVGMSWYEQMPSEPQQVLAGIMEALWSTSFQSPCATKYVRRALPSVAQTKLGAGDCPYHNAGGSHDCAGIHNHVHPVAECSKQASVALSSANTKSADVSGAAAGRSSALALAAALWLRA